MNHNYVDAIGALYPGVEVICEGDPNDYSQVKYLNGPPIPPQAQIDTDYLDLCKVRKIQELSDATNIRIIFGFTSNALGTNYMYDAEEVDQLNLTGSLASITPAPGQADTLSMPYATRDISTDPGIKGPKVYRLHTYLQLRQVLQDGTNFKLNMLRLFDVKRNYILTNITTIDQLDAVTLDSVDAVLPT